jgi:hypothetical protein
VAAVANGQFVWDDLAKYKAEGRFLDGYPDDQRTFFAPRDNVHGLLVALIGSAQHSIVVNMFGYDDDELNKIIQSKLANENVYVQMSLDRSQSTGAHEKQLGAQRDLAPEDRHHRRGVHGEGLHELVSVG